MSRLGCGFEVLDHSGEVGGLHDQGRDVVRDLTEVGTAVRENGHLNGLEARRPEVEDATVAIRDRRNYNATSYKIVFCIKKYSQPLR